MDYSPSRCLLNHGFRSLRLLLHISSPLLYVFTPHRLCPTSSHLIDFALRLRPKLNHKFGCRQILEEQKDYHQEFLQLSQTSTFADYGASPVREPFFDMEFSIILIPLPHPTNGLQGGLIWLLRCVEAQKSKGLSPN
ncbi:unnamed protein product [Prunus armeniaca]